MVDQFENKIANSIEKINKKIQRQHIIKNLPCSQMKAATHDLAPEHGRMTKVYTNTQDTAKILFSGGVQGGGAQPKQSSAKPLEDKDSRQSESSSLLDENQIKLTPIRRKSGDVSNSNDLNFFVPSPQDVITRATTAPNATNLTNSSAASDGDVPQIKYEEAKEATAETNEAKEPGSAAKASQGTAEKTAPDSDGEAGHRP